MGISIKIKFIIKIILSLSMLGVIIPYVFFHISGALCDCTEAENAHSIILPNTPNTRPECKAWYTVHQGKKGVSTLF
jgi:hypothetical protein